MRERKFGGKQEYGKERKRRRGEKAQEVKETEKKRKDDERECENLGGSLATIRSEEESKVVKDFLNQVSIPDSKWGTGYGVWLAGSDTGSEGNWYWDTYGQKPKISNIFSDWRENEPNNAGSFGNFFDN
ncbi:C-type lectin 9 [Plakobranchus ocellatus]|uniref:C-type lectin 9 n=1 Tax=Plakobranchus ocellatus TaxID=259542 RepID=A0AAV4BTM5_9GAST|nr:C-type lectin 9 [Plakobranchus ocellatus]